MLRSQKLRRAPVSEGQYDTRAGAAAFAPIVGTFGSLAVPAIIVFLTVPTDPHRLSTHTISLTAGLLIVGMVGSLFGAFGLAAIGAERDLTANLIPAVMYIAVPVAVSVISIIAAFEVLAAVYIPESKTLLALIVGVIGIVGVVFCALAIGDMIGAGPTDPVFRRKWIRTQWIQTRESAYRWADIVIGTTSIPAVVAIGLRAADVKVSATSASINIIVGIGVALTLVGTLASMLRTAHALDNNQQGLRPWEAFGSCTLIAVYTLILMLFLP
jgi:hypothetical protein